MRVMLALAATPVVLFGVLSSRQSVVLSPKPVATEGVRAQRLDEGTFKVRWLPVNELPPAVAVATTVGGEVQAGREKGATSVRVGAPTRLHPRRIVRQASLRDLCARHGLRRVITKPGRWPSWRCRR